MSSATPPTNLESGPLGSRQWQEARVLKELRTVERGLRARLLSIEYDTLRGLQLYATLAPLPLFANARAGAWYVPPSVPGAQLCAFKSCDGHYGRWSSSLRRPNTHVFKAAAEAGGVVIIDATRRGKNFPDSFMKTIPIWCAIINCVAELVSCMCANSSGSDTNSACPLCLPLHVHPDVPESERDQIRTRLSHWLADWRRAGVDLKRIVPSFADARSRRMKPLRPLWLRPGRPAWDAGVPLDSVDFTPIICISVSVAVPEGHRSFIEPSDSREVVCGIDFPPREAGFPYVQGAGDDEEAWCCGLTPKLFWKFRGNVMKIIRNPGPNQSSSQIDTALQDLISTLALQAPAASRVSDLRDSGHSLGVPIWATSIQLMSLPSVGSAEFATRAAQHLEAVIVLGLSEPPSDSLVNPERNDHTASNILWVPLTDHKRKLDYKYAMGRALGPCLSMLRDCCIEKRRKALVCCNSKTGDWCAGLAIAWISWHCKLVNSCDASNNSADNTESERSGELIYAVDTRRRAPAARIPKEQVHTAMLHFTSKFPQFQISRSTLKQLNRFFSSPLPSSTISETSTKEKT